MKLGSLLVLSLFSLTVLNPINASAQTVDVAGDAYFTVGKVRVAEVDEATNEEFDVNEFTLKDLMSKAGRINKTSMTDEVSEGDIDIDKIINYAKMAWKFVKDNKPVVNVKRDRANALPAGVSNAFDLTNWSTPVYKTYRVSFENLFGMSVVDFKFRAAYTYGGRYNGVGRYLTNVTIVPSTVEVAWGYTFNADVVVTSTVNIGTKSAPIAGMEYEIRYSVDTVMKHFDETVNFFAAGDGRFQKL